MNNNEFIPLNEIINSYLSYSFEEKLNILRKLSRDITFNEDYQKQIINKNFLSVIINDINNILFINKESNESKKENLTYVRIFFMFLHNLLVTESTLQNKIFGEIFKNQKIFEILKNIINKYKAKLKQLSNICARIQVKLIIKYLK